jgi:hypothetical protein
LLIQVSTNHEIRWNQGFSKHCKGGGNGPVHYLTQDMNPDGSARTPLPQVVRGDAELVRRLIDAVPFERTYTSGVLSFAPGEVITPAMEQAIMDGFERVAFAGRSYWIPGSWNVRMSYTDDISVPNP